VTTFVRERGEDGNGADETCQVCRFDMFEECGGVRVRGCHLTFLISYVDFSGRDLSKAIWFNGTSADFVTELGEKWVWFFTGGWYPIYFIPQ
jgi:hypothetical protein